jgi:hypothetical protein
VKRVRKRLTYANAMSTIAVFLAVGGATAFAAHHLGKGSVGAKQLKKNAVTTAKIRKHAVTAAKIKKGAIRGGKVANGSLTGVDINLATLGTVPNAAAANGQIPTKVFKTFNAGEGGVVADIAGFTLGASCEEEDIDVSLTSPTSANSVEIAQGSGNKHSVFEYDAASGGTPSVIRLDGSEENENQFGESTVSAATSSGGVISGNVGYDFGTFNGTPPKTCIVFGEILSG